MTGRKGYDLSNLCKRTRPCTRGPIQAPLQKEPAASNGSDFSSSVLDSSTPRSLSSTNSHGSQSFAHSHITNPHSPLDFQAPRETPQYPRRLSPGYTKTSGQYTLYNQHTGRGWRHVTPDSHIDPYLPQHDMTSSSHGSNIDRGCEPEIAARPNGKNLAGRGGDFNDLGLSVPPAGCKIGNRYRSRTVNTVYGEADHNLDLNIGFNVNSVASIVNKNISISSPYHKRTVYSLSTHKNARRISKKERRVVSRYGAAWSLNTIGGFLAPPSTTLFPFHRRVRRLRRHPISDIITSTTMNSSFEANQTARSLGSQHPESKLTPKITLTAPSDDEDHICP
ncbi:hypothetical protein F5Y02DRAFT_423307 [Annulohypoxylon stygium]|nr:hypothetical protein F5Y02DRAFT_423307 [Annulohypoxylon stygium]